MDVRTAVVAVSLLAIIASVAGETVNNTMQFTTTLVSTTDSITPSPTSAALTTTDSTSAVPSAPTTTIMLSTTTEDQRSTSTGSVSTPTTTATSLTTGTQSSTSTGSTSAATTAETTQTKVAINADITEEPTTVNPGTAADPAPSMTVLVLWIVLGVLLLLILCVAVGIFCVIASYHRRYKRKKQPTAMDILSKWEDVPDESSDIKLVSIKSIGDDEDKNGGPAAEKEENDGVTTAKNEETTTKKDESRTEGDGEKKEETTEEKREGDITLGTFGFPQVVVEPTASKAEPEQPEKKEEGQAGDKDKPHKQEQQNDGVVSGGSETKLGAELATTKVNQESGKSDKSSTSESTVQQDKQCGSPLAHANKTNTTEFTQKEKKVEPVPVHIPVFGIKEDEKSSVPSQEVKTPDKTNKPPSPKKDEAPTTTESSQSAEEVSKETETAVTKPAEPHTVDNKTVVVSDKPPVSTGGLQIFSNEDVETFKLLGVNVKDLGQDASTQL